MPYSRKDILLMSQRVFDKYDEQLVQSMHKKLQLFKSEFDGILSDNSISLREYFDRLVFFLGESIYSKKKLYLDTRYWIFLRDAALGRAKKSEHMQILSLLEELVSYGAIICPISDVMYIEAMKQKDSITKEKTFMLMDTFSSGGVSLMTEQYRVQVEIQNAFNYLFTQPDYKGSSPPSKKVWVRPNPLLTANFRITGGKNITFEERIFLEKATIRSMWDSSLRESLNNPDKEHPIASSKEFNDVAQQLNKGKNLHSHEIKSFEQAFKEEIAGCLNPSKPAIRDLLSRGKILGIPKLINSNDLDRVTEKLCNMVINIFIYRPEIISKLIPSIYVHAMCHATFRRDNVRKFNGNWILDFHHASAAVGYYDAMFTENGLRVLLTEGRLSLQKQFNIQILSDESDVLNYLDGLLRAYNAPPK